MHGSFAKRLLSNPTLALMFGYGVGQGSLLLLVLALRANGAHPEQIGTIVLITNALSLAFQFSDYGNSPHCIKLAAANRQPEISTFRQTRALIAIPFVGISCAVIGAPLSPAERLSIILAGGVGGLLYAFTDLVKYEAANQYWKLSLIQSFSWISTSTLFFISSTQRNPLATTCATLIWTAIPFTALAITNASSAFNPRKLIPKLTDATPFILLIPTLAGQVWGRGMLSIVGQVGGLTTLSGLAIARNLHTALVITCSFAIRPAIRAILVNQQNTSTSASDSRKLTKITAGMAFTCLAISLLGSIAKSHFPPDISYWMPTLYGSIAWIIALPVSTSNQIKFGAKIFASIELAGMATHCATFLALSKHNIILAFIAADFSRLAVISIPHIARRLNER